MAVITTKIIIKQRLESFEERERQKKSGRIGIKPLFIMWGLGRISNSQVKLGNINISSCISRWRIQNQFLVRNRLF